MIKIIKIEYVGVFENGNQCQNETNLALKYLQEEGFKILEVKIETIQTSHFLYFSSFVLYDTSEPINFRKQGNIFEFQDSIN